ncbi:MAG: hypothetical protein AABX96_03110 [Nanoarchaeota archaeon]
MVCLRLIFSFSLSFFLLLFVVSSLGISPALKNIDFYPGAEVNITYTALSDDPEKVLDVSMGGDFAQYATSSVSTVKGTTSFLITLKFPMSAEPGNHYLSVSLSERPSESEFIGTAVQIGGILTVIVPYPGLYGELKLSLPDGNVNDQIPVELRVINRGDQILHLKYISIDFISSGGYVARTLNFTPVDISSPGDRYFRKYLDAKGLDAGNYLGVARVSYGDVVREVNQSFRIGSLFVNITNYTDSIVSGGIQKFYVSLENLWNSPNYGVYVDVNISNNIGEHYFFRTPSVDLNPWEKKTVESYFDTENLLGIYKVILNASYGGKSTAVYGSLLVSKKSNIIIYYVVALFAVLLLVLIYFIVKHFSRSKKK